MKRNSFAILSIAGAAVLGMASCDLIAPKDSGEDAGGHVHTYSELHTQVNPTCLSQGTKAYYTCTGCDQLFNEDKEVISELEKILALGHTPHKHAGEAATCTSAGTGDYWTCDNEGDDKLYGDAACTQVISSIPVVNPKGHHPVKVDGQAASCTLDGWKEYYECECAAFFEDLEATKPIANLEAWKLTDGRLEKISHKNAQHVDAVEPECTVDGVLEHYHCPDCNKDFTDNTFATEMASVVDPKSGHDMSHTEGKAKSCAEAGNLEYWYCSTCEKYFKDAAGEEEYEENEWLIPASHEMTKHDAVAATGFNAGNSEYYSCSDCDKYFSDEAGTNQIEENSWVIAPLGTITMDKSCSTNQYEIISKEADVIPTELYQAAYGGEGHFLQVYGMGGSYAYMKGLKGVEKIEITGSGNAVIRTSTSAWSGWTGYHVVNLGEETKTILFNPDVTSDLFFQGYLDQTLFIDTIKIYTANETPALPADDGDIFDGAKVDWWCDYTYTGFETVDTKDSNYAIKFGAELQQDNQWLYAYYKLSKSFTVDPDHEFTMDAKCLAGNNVFSITFMKDGAVIANAPEQSFSLNDGWNSLKYTLAKAPFEFDGIRLTAFVTSGAPVHEYVIDNVRVINHVHSMTKHAATAPTGLKAGDSEYYSCSACGRYYSDEAGLNEIAKDSWIGKNGDALKTITFVEECSNTAEGRLSQEGDNIAIEIYQGTHDAEGHFMQIWGMAGSYAYFKNLKGVEKIEITGSGNAVIRTSTTPWGGWNGCHVVSLGGETKTVVFNPDVTNDLFFGELNNGTLFIDTLKIYIANETPVLPENDNDIFDGASVEWWVDTTYTGIDTVNTNNSNYAIKFGAERQDTNWVGVNYRFAKNYTIDATHKFTFDAKLLAGNSAFSITLLKDGQFIAGAPEQSFNLVDGWNTVQYTSATQPIEFNGVKLTAFTTNVGPVHEYVVDNVHIEEVSRGTRFEANADLTVYPSGLTSIDSLVLNIDVKFDGEGSIQFQFIDNTWEHQYRVFVLYSDAHATFSNDFEDDKFGNIPSGVTITTLEDGYIRFTFDFATLPTEHRKGDGQLPDISVFYGAGWRQSVGGYFDWSVAE